MIRFQSLDHLQKNSYDKPQVTDTTYDDIHAPTLVIPTDTSIMVGEAYDVMDGVSATDYDYVLGTSVDISEEIVIVGDVDTSKAGVYTVKYYITDGAGNATSGEVTVTVQELVSVIETGHIWSYLDDNTDPAAGLENLTDWTLETFDTSAWSVGASPFGAKNGALDLGNGFLSETLLNQYIDGDSANANVEGYFFATTFEVEDLGLIEEVNGKVIYDDEAIVYLNGNEIAYTVVSSGGSTSGKPGSGSSSITDTIEEEKTSNLWYTSNSVGDPTSDTFTISRAQLEEYLVEGVNVLAVELHNNSATSSDIYFDMESLTLTLNPNDSQNNSENEDLKDELDEEPKNELDEDQKDDLDGDLKDDLDEDPKDDLDGDLKDDLDEDLKDDLNGELKDDLDEVLKDDLDEESNEETDKSIEEEVDTKEGAIDGVDTGDLTNPISIIISLVMSGLGLLLHKRKGMINK